MDSVFTQTSLLLLHINIKLNMIDEIVACPFFISQEQNQTITPGTALVSLTESHRNCARDVSY